MFKLFSRLCATLFLVLPWLLCAGCNEQQETRLTTTVRQAESPPPVAEPAAELLLTQRAFIEVSEKVTSAVVNIRAERVRTAARLNPLFEEFFGDLFRTPRSEQRERSLGSGFILSDDGYILTNEHVVSGAEEIKVRLTDQRVFPGKIVGVDPKTEADAIAEELGRNGFATLGKQCGGDFGFLQLARHQRRVAEDIRTYLHDWCAAITAGKCSEVRLGHDRWNHHRMPVQALEAQHQTRLFGKGRLRVMVQNQISHDSSPAN